jgi:hypothetical protein
MLKIISDNGGDSSTVWRIHPGITLIALPLSLELSWRSLRSFTCSAHRIIFQSSSFGIACSIGSQCTWVVPWRRDPISRSRLEIFNYFCCWLSERERSSFYWVRKCGPRKDSLSIWMRNSSGWRWPYSPLLFRSRNLWTENLDCLFSHKGGELTYYGSFKNKQL